MRSPGPRATGVIAAFVQHRNAANLLMILLALFGVWGLSQINRQLMPTIETRSISVNVNWSGASAEDVEKNILQNIEPVVRFLDGVTDMSSNASEGRGQIRLSFSRGTDMQDAEDRVQAAVDSATNLPESAETPSVSQFRFFDPVAAVGLSGPFPEQTLRGFAREIRDGLLDAGLDQVTFTGYREREITISVDEARLRQLDLTLDDLSRALLPNIVDRPSGSLPGDFEAQIRALAREVSVSQIAATEIKSLPTGETLTFGDVATISDGYNEDTALGFMRGQPAIRLSVSRAVSADAVESYDKIKAYVEEIRPTLPPTLNVQIFDAAAEQITSRLWLLISNGGTGLVLVLIILFIFLRARIALWVAVGIPVSIMATVGVMYLTGQTLDMISMFAMMMTLGIIVDDAIVVGEHTATRYAAGDDRVTAAITGAKRMAIPVIAASLTTMSAFGPILMVGDVVGQIMAPLPMVVLAVLTVSLIECFFILPGHLAHSLPTERKPDGWFRRNFNAGFGFFRDRIFGFLSDLSFRWRYATVALALFVSILGFALLMSGQLRFQFFPTAEGESFNVYATFQPGIPQDEMRGIITDIEAAVSKLEADLSPEGEPLILTTYANLDLEDGGANFNVYLTPSEDRSVRTSDITRGLRDALPLVAGVERISVREFRGGPQGRAIDIELTGSDVSVLKQASEELQGILEGFTGVTAISDTLRYGNPELVMALTPRGTALGFTLETIGSQIRDAFEGRTVTTVATPEEEITIRLQSLTDAEGSAALRELWVRAPSGTFVPLNSVVSFSERQGFSRINKEEGRTVVQVQADVEDGVTNGDEVLSRLETDYLPSLTGKHGISYDLGGSRAERNAAFADLQLGALLALGVMYIIIAWSFGSYFAPLAVMLIIPFGIVGSIWGHYLLGFDLTVISVMGLLGLAGILVNDSIVLISRLIERQEQGEGLREAATGAARDRLRAVLLTSLTTIGGLIPLLFEKSLEAQFLIPMAITIIFGLGLATLLVLFLVPAFIAIGADIGAVLRWGFMTRNAPTFRELLSGQHHETPPVQPAE